MPGPDAHHADIDRNVTSSEAATAIGHCLLHLKRDAEANGLSELADSLEHIARLAWQTAARHGCLN
jgi:hypothetical protein